MTLTTTATTTTTASLYEAQQQLRRPSGICPNCGGGSTVGSSAEGTRGEATLQQQRIRELEAQVRMLTSKATAAVDKMADYEDELRRLRASQNTDIHKDGNEVNYNNDLTTKNASISVNTAGNDSHKNESNDSTANSSSVSRFTSILGVRRQGSNQKRENESHTQTSSTLPSKQNQLQTNPEPSKMISSSPTVATPRETTLQAALAHEQTLRRQAEGQLTQVNGELQDMSAQLFEQANEMVASERKARAKLEERVQVLEQRDGEKRKRLERLEGALNRIERVKVLIGES